MGFLQTIGSLVIALVFAGLAGLLLGAFAKRLFGFLGEDVQQRLQPVVSVAVAVLAFFWMLRADRADRFLASPEASKMASTMWGVLLAVGVSAALFVAANILFNQAGKSYGRFSALLGGVIGFVTFGLLDGNRLIQHISGRTQLADGLHGVVNANEWSLLLFSILIAAGLGLGLGHAAGIVRDNPGPWRLGGLTVGLVGGFLWGLFFAERIPVDTSVALLWTPLIGAALTAALGFALSKLDQPVRLAVGTIGGAVLGLMAGGLAFTSIVPGIQITHAIIWPVALAIVGAGISKLRGQPLLGGALVGALIGWIIGVFLLTNPGGPRAEAFSAFGVAGALAGARFSFNPRPTAMQRSNIENRSRSWIFLAPAGFFICVGLIAPLIRTIALSFERSFRDENGQRVQEIPSIENYRGIFGNAANWDFSNWRALFTSAPFEVGLAMLAFALVVAALTGKRSGNSFPGARFIVPAIGVVMLFTGFRQFRLIQGDGVTEEALQAGLLPRR